MNIDFAKLLQLLLPVSLRTGLIDIVTACSGALSSIYENWKSWYADIVLQSAITAQVMYMELIINYRLFGSYDRTIYITDGDQTTVDFVVNVPAGVSYNVQLLVGLLDKYKATGKRYTIAQSELTYEVEWSNFVCELDMSNLNFVAEWSELLCEKKLQNIITVQLNGNEIAVGAEYNVASDLSFSGHASLDGDNDVPVNFTLLTGKKYKIVPIGSPGDTFNELLLQITNLASDDTYYYKLNIVIL